MSVHRLAIDYGTSNTVAVMRRPDASVRPLLFDGSPLLPSAVFADPDGRMLVGQDAERGARLDPARFEPNPKRRINDLEVLLGDRTFSMVDLVAATLRRVAGEATRVTGEPTSDVTMTYPAEWGQARRRVLLEAAEVAGLGRVTLVPEPVAAASYFAGVLRHRVPTGSCVVVYDLGAGTFDASVVRHDPDGLDTLACRGLDDFGGVDLDAILVDLIAEVLKVKAPEAWERLSAPVTAADRRHRRMLWDDARQARETLSREPSAGIHCVLADEDVYLTRDEFEAAASAGLARTVDLTMATLREARMADDRVAGWFLVGGASRTPLIATLLHRCTGQPPIVLEDPQVVVAEGALYAHAAGQAPAIGPPAPVPSVAPVPSAPPVRSNIHGSEPTTALDQVRTASVADAAAALAAMPPATAAEILGELHPKHSGVLLTAMPLPIAADRLAAMSADRAAVRLAALPPEAAVAVLAAMPVRAAADRLGIIPVRVAIPLLLGMTPDLAGARLGVMAPTAAALRLAGMPPHAAAQLVVAMPPPAAAARLSMMLPPTAAAILRGLPWNVTGHVLGLMPPTAGRDVYTALTGQ